MTQNAFLSDFQHRLAQTVSLEGVGLHSGKKVALRITPAPVHSGIRFVRIDGAEELTFHADATIVGDTKLGTVLNHPSGATLSTVEHLMAAFWGAGVDNAIVYVHGAEIPILDGSSAPFLEAFARVGLQAQAVRREILTITQPVRFELDGSVIELFPYDGFAADVSIDFADSAIGQQRALYDFEDGSIFNRNISNCRTFGFLHEVEYLQSIGLARGGSLDNAIVIDKGTVLNPEGLRHENEFARHKLLDLVGDLFLCGQRIRGLVVAHRPGHTINTYAAAKLQKISRTERDSSARNAPLSTEQPAIRLTLPAFA